MTKNCCDYGCTQADHYPVRATRNAGVFNPEGDPVTDTEAKLLYLIIAAFCSIMATLAAGVVVFAAL